MDTRTARQEFEQQVLAGELTNIEQYFDDESAQEERYLLAKHGINVDRVIAMDGVDVIIRFIRDSVHKDRYDEWKDHPKKDVRLELAMHGYFLEQYIHDSEPEIREEVMNLRLDLGLERMFNLNDQEVFLGLVMRQRRPNLQILQKYIEDIAPGLEQDRLADAFRLKYQAMIIIMQQSFRCERRNLKRWHMFNLARRISNNGNIRFISPLTIIGQLIGNISFLNFIIGFTMWCQGDSVVLIIPVSD